MILWDVNLWVYAFRHDSPTHLSTKALIEASLAERKPFLFNRGIAASFLRLVSNPRVFKVPSPMREAWDFVDALAERPNAVEAEMDAMCFGIFKHICLVNDVKGNAVPDAMIAALAIRYDATLVSADAGFRNFTGLRVEIVS